MKSVILVQSWCHSERIIKRQIRICFPLKKMLLNSEQCPMKLKHELDTLKLGILANSVYTDEMSHNAPGNALFTKNRTTPYARYAPQFVTL